MQLEISQKLPPKSQVACVRIFPALSIQTARVTFTTSPPSPSHRGHPRWYRKRSSHIVPRRRQIAYINRQRPFIFPCQRFHGIILAPCRDFSSPNKRVKINRRVVEALYWDGIIPFTSLNGAGGQSNQGPATLLYLAIFTVSKTRNDRESEAFRRPRFTKWMKRHFSNFITKDLYREGGKKKKKKLSQFTYHNKY